MLQKALAVNFQEVTVDVVECPNLTEKPYNLAGSGLGGSPTLMEVGGPPYLLPLVDRSKLYDMKTLAQRAIGKKDVLAMGAGAGPFPLRGTNCEGIYNLKISADGQVLNKSYSAKVHGPQENCVLESIPNSETKFGLLLNLFLSEGKSGKVLKVHCKKRIGSLNFIESIRFALLDFYKEKCVGLGGMFMMKTGRAHQHVMRDFSKTPIHSEEELNQWLKFYDMPAQLNAVGTLITHENVGFLFFFFNFSFLNKFLFSGPRSPPATFPQFLIIQLGWSLPLRHHT